MNIIQSEKIEEKIGKNTFFFEKNEYFRLEMIFLVLSRATDWFGEKNNCEKNTVIFHKSFRFYQIKSRIL